MKYNAILLVLFLILSPCLADEKSIDDEFSILYNAANLVVSGTFDFTDVPAFERYSEVSSYKKVSDIKFLIKKIYKGNEKSPYISVPIHNYILPNQSGTMSRGDQWYQKDISDRAKLSKTRDIFYELLEKKSSGEIDEKTYSKLIEEKVDSTIREIKYSATYFESPYLGNPLVITEERDYILFLRGFYEKDKDPIYMMVDFGESIVVGSESVKSQLLARKKLSKTPTE